MFDMGNATVIRGVADVGNLGIVRRLICGSERIEIFDQYEDGYVSLVEVAKFKCGEAA